MLAEKYQNVRNQQNLSFGDNEEIQTKIEKLTKKVRILETQMFWYMSESSIHKQGRMDYEDY